MKNDIKKIAYAVESAKKVESLKDEEKRKKEEYNELLKSSLYSCFFLEYEKNNKNLDDTIYKLLNDRYNIIEELGHKIYKSTNIKKADDLLPDKIITLNKYNKNLYNILDDLNKAYLKVLTGFKNEFSIIYKYERKKSLESALNEAKSYILNIFEEEIEADGDYLITLEALQAREVCQDIIQQVKDKFNYSLSFKEYESIINEIKKMYKVDISYQSQKEKAIKKELDRKNKSIVKRIPLSWKIYGAIKIFKKLK